MNFNGFLLFSTPVWCVGIPTGFFFSEKMTSLKIFDMYYIYFDISYPYLVKFGQYFINFSPPAAYERIPLGINRTLSHTNSCSMQKKHICSKWRTPLTLGRCGGIGDGWVGQGIGR